MAIKASLVVRYEDRKHLVDLADFDRFEWRAVKEASGKSQPELIAGLVAMDLDTISYFLWLQLRREQPELDPEFVNLKLGDVLDDDEGADAGPPG